MTCSFYSCHWNLSERSFFKDIHPGISTPEYNEYIKDYKKASIIDANSVLHFREIGLKADVENYYNRDIIRYYGLSFKKEDPKDTLLTLADLNNLLGFLQKIYGSPTGINLRDTSKYGYAYAEWKNIKEYNLKLDLDKSTGKNTLRLLMLPTLALWTIIDKKDWEEIHPNEPFKAFEHGWKFSFDTVLDHYFKKIVFAHNLDSARNYAKDDLKINDTSFFSAELMVISVDLS